MSVKSRGKGVATVVSKGSRKIGRRVAKPMRRAGEKLERGARTMGRNITRAGRKVETATRDGAGRARRRMPSGHRAKSSSV